MGADPTCTPRRIPAGSGFVDKGLEVHLVRNEGLVDLVTVVVSFVPKGAETANRRSKPRQLLFLGAVRQVEGERHCSPSGRRRR